MKENIFSNNTMTYDFSFPLEPSNSFVVYILIEVKYG